MEGVTVSAKNLRNPEVSVKVDPAGIWLSARDERDPQMWVMVYITTAALWAIINGQDDGAEFFYPPIPPLYTDEIDLGDLAVPVPLVALPPVPPLRASTIPPPKG